MGCLSINHSSVCWESEPVDPARRVFKPYNISSTFLLEEVKTLLLNKEVASKPLSIRHENFLRACLKQLLDARSRSDGNCS